MYLQSRLPTGSRPLEIGAFMKNGRKYEKAPNLSKEKVQGLGLTWMIWWSDLQPAERSTEAWPFNRTPLDGCEWNVLRQGGPNGIYLVIVSLAWWLRGAAESEARNKVFEAIADVSWAVSQMNSLPSLPNSSPVRSGKHREHDLIAEPPAKRSKRK